MKNISYKRWTLEWEREIWKLNDVNKRQRMIIEQMTNELSIKKTYNI